MEPISNLRAKASGSRDKMHGVKGMVYLVGAGPGDPELLTLKALRILKAADVVLHDELVAREILGLIPSTARVQNVGKRCGQQRVRQEKIHELMVEYASEGLRVVRLKGGDPLIFGRAGEEMEALERSGVEYEIVPGVTAACAAAASARVALTDRRMASRLIILTNHHWQEKNPGAWGGMTEPDATLAVYMPYGNVAQLVAALDTEGWSGQTPCIIVSRAATPEQQIYRTRLEKLAEAPILPRPALLLIGEVVAAARDVGEEMDEDVEKLATTV